MDMPNTVLPVFRVGLAGGAFDVGRAIGVAAEATAADAKGRPKRGSQMELAEATIDLPQTVLVRRDGELIEALEEMGRDPQPRPCRR